MKSYPQDKFIAATILPFIPLWVAPNYITFVRIGATPFVALLIATGSNAFIALGLFLLMALTDLIDGALARQRNEITTLGKLIDPIADKIMILTIAFLLLPKYNSLSYFFILAGLEAFGLFLSLFFLKSGREFAANVWGKLKLNFQVFGILCFVITQYFYADHWVVLGQILLSIAVVLHIVSLCTFILQRKVAHV